MCCKNKARRSEGCCSRRYNNVNALPLGGPTQASAIVYERRPGLVDMLAQHIAQKRQAKQEQQRVMGYEPKQVSFIDQGKVEDQKLMEERNAQAMWDEKMKADARIGAGVDHVQRPSWVKGNNRFSTMSVGTELPSYGQAMKQ
jgi:hypothetical protein